MAKSQKNKIFERLRVLFVSKLWRRFYLQRLFMTKRMRDLAANLIADRFRPEFQSNSSMNVGHLCDSLEKSGISPLGRVLTPVQTSELVEYFRALEVEDPYKPELGEFSPCGFMIPEGTHIGHHSAADIMSAPYLLELANNKLILSLAASFLGCKPTISYMACWWSFPTKLGPQQAEMFHRDVDDWRFVKLFVYLTDVGSTSGPHVYVKESASAPVLNRIARFSDSEVLEAFPLDSVLTLCAEAGEGFMENTFGIHKGLSVQEGKRLIFQVVYSLNELPYGPASPIRGTTAAVDRGFDPWINRVYFGG